MDPTDAQHVRSRKSSSDFGVSFSGPASNAEEASGEQHAMIDVKRLSTRTGAVLRELGTDKEGMVSIQDIASALKLGDQHGRHLILMRRLIVVVVLIAVLTIAGNTMATVITVTMTK